MTRITPLFQRRLPRTYFYATLGILALNLAVFLLTEIDRMSLGLLAMNPLAVLGEGAWWQVLTYMYTHGSSNHLLVNMIFLLLAGLKVEERMGSWEFLVFYHVCGLLAGGLSLGIFLLTGQSSIFLLGSSGAVFAVILAYAVYRFDGRVLFIPLAVFIVFGGVQAFGALISHGEFSVSLESLFYVLVLAAVVAMIFRPSWHQNARNIVLLFAAYDLLSQVFNPYGGVAHLTHLAGFVFAFLYLRLRLRLDAWQALRSS